MRDTFTFDEDAMRLIKREIFAQVRKAVDNTRHAIAPALFNDAMPLGIRFRNTSGEIIPAYACMRITGAERKAGRVVLTVAKPSTTFQRLYLVNGSKPVAAASTAYGYGTYLDEGGEVLYESGTPAYGESWGPKASQWSLAKWRYGFTVLGATAGSMMAKQREVNVVYGQTNGAINKGSSGTVDLYDGNNSAISSTSITATNRFANVSTTKKVMATWIGGTWLLSAAEC